MKKVHVVNHTHWDREWYFTTMDAILLSDNTFSMVIDELLSNREAKFCLDGQSSILDDFIARRPDQLDNVKKLVDNKQLSIGPWYTQTDSFFVDEESFIRNLIIGIRDSKKYGEEMKIGYLPDTFGFNAQMPTILANCGLDNIVFWRGINFKKHVSEPYFIWRGLGDKEITAMNLVDGYGTAAFLKNTPDYLNERLYPSVEKVESLTDDSNLLIPAGGDQLEIIHDLPEILEEISKEGKYEFVESSYEEFRESLRGKADLAEYRGEFREPCTTRAHKSIGSVRYDIKRSNFLVEQKLLRRIEPLIAIAEAFQINVSHELIVDAWKKIMEGHAHDSMGGCVSDDVAIDILHRMKEANEIADGIENYIVKRFTDKLQLTSNQVIVFNTTSKNFKGYKTIDFLAADKNLRLADVDDAVLVKADYFKGKDNLLLETPEGPKYINEDPYYRLYVLANVEIPSMGFKVFNIEQLDKEIESPKISKTNSIKNKFYTISSNNGNLSIETKDGKKLDYFIEFEDMGNAGDTYDFSPVEGGKSIILNPDLIQVRKSSLIEEMVLSGEFRVPKDLEERVGKTNTSGRLDITLVITLAKGSSLIDCKVTVENQVLSHRLRVKLNPDITTTKTIASVPFGFIEREELTEDIPEWHKQYVEYPIDLEPYDKSVSIIGTQNYLTAFGKGIKEYQLRDNKLYLTLFASTSQLGKPNLAYRPGRASGDTTKKGHVMMPTPMAELLGELTFEFALQLSDGSFNEYEVSKSWKQFSDQSICYQNQALNKFIHRLDNKIQEIDMEHVDLNEFSLLQVDSKAFDSSFGFSMYHKDAYLLRLANPTEVPIPLDKFDFHQFSKYEFVNCQEQSIESVDEVPPYDMVTIKVWR
ncbi:glycoside hydrolase family 38 N-terminal domain-containing protein [Enterococcus xiangfangensis]|uniref:Glycoside hydrolase family 38 C-terminal domain-containing protein n=1 Tax=Enterococcus xiangfangensis TaxID=1296537 RepID=A0ABU3FCL7_9ENTE|nr:glycoside hydrolase family 38 C-terminal domain-containing protein [Enterococcus xiangfangensis]MDT2760146.1 glycoside hydrolase family 38 C-terminal domain-containing protein [Enterococcus xiangfangensis]